MYTVILKKNEENKRFILIFKFFTKKVLTKKTKSSTISSAGLKIGYVFMPIIYYRFRNKEEIFNE